MHIFFLNMFLALFAAVSPGPNIVLVTQNSLVFGRKNGLTTALGVIVGVFFWLLALALGLIYILNNPKTLFYFHVFSAAYLLYIIYMIISINVDAKHDVNHVSKTFFYESLFITLLNPEIAIFYGSIMTSIFADHPEIANNTAHIILYIFGFLCIESTVFLSAAYFVSSVRKFMINYIKVVKTLAVTAIIYFILHISINIHTEYHILF